LACQYCNAYQVVEKLKELSGVATQAAQQASTAPVYQPIEQLESPIIGDPNDSENSLWSGVRSTNSIEDYDTYLAQYPNGRYVALAHSLIKKLQDAAADQAWQTANKAGSESDYRNYLDQYPQSKYTELAKTKFNKLKLERETREENALWKTVEWSEEINDIQAYIDRYPNGTYLVAAQERLVAIDEKAWQLVQTSEYEEPLNKFIAKYPTSPHLAAALERLDYILGKMVKVDFDLFESEKSISPRLSCRSGYEISAPGGESISALFRKELYNTLKNSNLYSHNAHTTLSGKLVTFDFGSWSSKYEIELIVNSSNGKNLTLSETYSYTGGFSGKDACNSAQNALVPAMRYFMQKLVSSPKFAELITNIKSSEKQ